MDSITFARRFWARVYKSEYCWIWTKHPDQDGYGKTTVNGKSTRTHRVAWMLIYGPIPDGMWVLHTCDNRLCVRPDHLYLGTVLDNNRDREARGRGGQLRGEKSGTSKLTEADVRTIRKLATEGHSYVSIGRKIGTCAANVRAIAKGMTWRHLL